MKITLWLYMLIFDSSNHLIGMQAGMNCTVTVGAQVPVVCVPNWIWF